MIQTAFVTGATGIVGSRLVEALVKADWNVVVLARSSSGLSASSRMKRVLEAALGTEGLEKVEVVEGDVCRPDCGLDAETISRLKGKCEVFWHCAGDTRFEPRLRDKIHCTNVTGTANAISTAKVLCIENFAHISTTFLFGSFVGVGAERPHPDLGQVFNNPYEESKFMSERLVTDSNLNWILFRPPIVVGDSKDGAVWGFSGYYGFMREFWKFKDAAVNGSDEDNEFLQYAGFRMCGNRLNLPIDVPGRKGSILTIACVDFVVNAMVNVARLPQGWHEVYNLVPSQSKTFIWWLDASLRVLGIEGVRVVEPDALVIDRSRGVIIQLFSVALCKGANLTFRMLPEQPPSSLPICPKFCRRVNTQVLMSNLFQSCSCMPSSVGLARHDPFAV